MNITKQKQYLALGVLATALAPSLATAFTLLDFSTANVNTAIPSGPYAGITYTSVKIQGGAAQAATHNAGSGVQTDFIGGFPYDGTFFDPDVNGSNTASTSIGFASRDRVSNGENNDSQNYIGLCVSFSAPVPITSFGFIDLDGTDSFRSNEWTGSFAYNSTTATTVSPTVTVGDPSITQATETVNWSGLTGAPTSAVISYKETTGTTDFNADPDDADSQVSYNYSSQLVTDLYFLWGVRENAFNNGFSNGVGNSGVTGFTVAPEPTSALLLSLGMGVSLLCRRR